MYIWLLLLLNTFSLWIMFKGIVVSYKQFMSLFLLYCIASIYFVVFPLFLDVLSIALNYDNFWKILISDNPLVYPYYLDIDMLWRVTIFVLIFNLIVYFSFFLFQKKKSKSLQKDQIIEIKKTSKNEIFYLKLFTIVGWFGLFLFILLYGFHWEMKGFGYIERTGQASIPFGSIIKIIMRASLALSGIAVFYASFRKKYLILLVALTPSVLIVILTSERPFIVPILICIMYGIYLRVIGKKSLFSVKSLFIGILAIYIIPLIFLILRNGIEVVMEFLPYPIHRDSSLNNLYYVFSDRGIYNDIGTHFLNIIRLITTGIMPSSLFGTGFDNSLDVTRYLAVERLNWQVGTLHPTLYGWIFIDMKWWGLLFAIFIGFILSLPSRFTTFPAYVRVGICALSAVFILVAMRGSVQFAYSVWLYGLLYLFLIYVLLRVLPKKSKKLKNRR